LAKDQKRHNPELRGLGSAIIAAADQARIGVMVTVAENGEWRTEYASRAAAEVLGFSPEELLGLPPDSLFQPGDLPRVREWRRQRRIAAGDAPKLLEIDVLGKDGTRVPVRFSSSGTLIEKRRAWVDFFVDRREPLRAERELETAVARFRSLVEVAPDAVVIAGAERVILVNSALVRLLGASSLRELAATTAAEQIHPDDLPIARERLRRLLSGEKLAPYELRVKRMDGAYVTIEVVDMLIEWDGKPAALAIGRDVSERRLLEAELMQTDRLTAVGTLAAGVAHEINNPLAYVLLNLEYMLRELPRYDGDPARLGKLLERLAEARHGVERVSTIVGDLRAFSRGDAERRGSLEVRRVLASALRVAEAHILGRARVLEDYQAVPAVGGNAARLEQVFLNLLINAVQALPPDRAEQNEIRIRLFRDGARVIVEIADNGVGIAAELLDRVFDPFFTTKPAGIGTGLGLPICHSIVKSLGGEIGVESVLGKGTVFRVALPAVDGARIDQVAATPLPASFVHRRARVLVVDDELPLAAMLKRVLEEEHEVLIRGSAREALELLLDDDRFDVVLCDLLMPAMSGMDLHRELARKRAGFESRLVFMTGGAFTPRAAEFLANVSNPRLEKPFDLRQVQRLVRNLTK
jgi:PAS domain S-box-containing protein